MWKWTDFNNIKAIILDGNSLDDDYLNYPYQSIINDIKVFMTNTLSKKSDKNIETIKYIDTSFLLQEVLKRADCQSYSIIAISGDILFLKEMMQNHIGTIFVKNIIEDHLKNIPDFAIQSKEKLTKILNGTYIGYGAEVYSSGYNNSKKKSLIKTNIEILLDNNNNKNITLYFGGRYYSKTHNFINDDALSIMLLNFKNRYIKAIDEYYDSAIVHINKEEKIDIITSVPLKPQDIVNNKFDRFNSLQLNKSKKIGLELKNIIECNKDFTQKSNNFYTRQENVKDAYEILNNVEHKNILILDDLYTSGCTIKEIAKKLYENGANNVIAILLAVNQTIESTSIQYQKIICPICKNQMSLKINQNNDKLFFGCNSYKEHPDQNCTIPCHEGIKKLKDINKLKIEAINDLNDEY